jgi:hypothetical protein
VRWKPIAPALANCLVDHAAARSTALATDPLLRYRDGRPLTTTRYDHHWERLGDKLFWITAQGISTHGLHHPSRVEHHHRYGTDADLDVIRA